jgi:hypothetical protein
VSVNVWHGQTFFCECHTVQFVLGDIVFQMMNEKIKVKKG